MIDALRFVKTPDFPAGTNLEALVRFIEHGGGEVIIRPPEALGIVTLEGTMAATVGDWIIRGVHGEFYPCKPDIFEATYEAAE